jgi:hypothetical protein
MLKSILIVVVLAHGIGHILFLVPLLGIANWGQSTQSWLLGNGTLAKLLGGLLWLVALVGFAATGIGMIGQQDWWSTAALLSCSVSLLGLIVFWTNPTRASAFFAAAFDIVVPISLLVVRWPTIDLMGA